ncbi:MAG: hypothetical protein KME27_03125 [Lyngbya sp. HA4199-MV5]|nr:hypothetical protein [Lyngbya sp. HA4199-MV5]
MPLVVCSLEPLAQPLSSLNLTAIAPTPTTDLHRKPKRLIEPPPDRSLTF